jgi:hypothetical protein
MILCLHFESAIGRPFSLFHQQSRGLEDKIMDFSHESGLNTDSRQHRPKSTRRVALNTQPVSHWISVMGFIGHRSANLSVDEKNMTFSRSWTPTSREQRLNGHAHLKAKEGDANPTHVRVKMKPHSNFVGNRTYARYSAARCLSTTRPRLNSTYKVDVLDET